MGSEKFEHKLHDERARRRRPSPGMKAGLPGTFHNLTARTGNCINCHKQQNVAGKKAPLECMECNKRENA